MSKSLQGLSPSLAAPRGSPWRRLAASTLRQASRVLARLARKLAVAPAAPRSRPEPLLEFYAQAGAPEGALYLDGQLIGHLPGVTRL
jgi:hypothetical protein